MENTHTLTLQGLTKRYGDLTALDHVDVTFTPGVYGILGANGAGKSTMMNLIADNLSRTEGKILFDGTDILQLGRAFQKKLGYMPQQQGFYESMTADTFLFYMAEVKAIPKRLARAHIGEILSTLHLSDVRHKRLSGFSGGMRQRVLLAQALLGDPPPAWIPRSASAPGSTSRSWQETALCCWPPMWCRTWRPSRQRSCS